VRRIGELYEELTTVCKEVHLAGDSPIKGAMGKRGLQLDLALQIGPETTLQDILIVVEVVIVGEE